MKRNATSQKPLLATFWKLLKILIISGTTLFVLFLGIILLPEPYYKEGFRDLEELQEYAKTIDEFIEMDGKNFFYPSYESYYQKKFAPSLMRKLQNNIHWILFRLGLKKEPLFSSSFFKTILIEVTKSREQNDWIGNFVQKLELNKDSQVVVFGDVQGAYHGLVRCLTKLMLLNIIDINLKITNKAFYIIFLGNVVNRSPYTLEMFSILLRLLKINPDNVIYLKGTNEFTDYWKQHTLKRELEMRINQLSHSKIPLENEVVAFFNTLPITLYCGIPFLANREFPYFKITPLIDDKKLLSLIDESSYSNFLTNKNNHILETLKLGNQIAHTATPTQNASMKAIVTGILKRENYEPMDGLRELPPTKGIPTWTILSTSAETYRMAINFFYDAFTIITPAKELSQWNITLYNRDIRNKDQNFNTRSSYFFSKPVEHKQVED